MNVFLKNVPQDLTHDTLREELQPFVKALGISDWDIQKPRKKNFASITFLRPADGEAFLSTHGEVAVTPHPRVFLTSGRHPRSAAKLYITKTPIYVTKSRFPPNRHILSHLQNEHEKQLKEAERRRDGPRGVKASPLAVPVVGMALGKNVFAGDEERLTFCEQSILSSLHATAKFTNHVLIIVCSGHFRMDMPYDATEVIIADQSHQALTVILREPPRVFAIRSSDTVKWERQTNCPGWPSHQKYASQCLVYRLSIAGPDFDAVVSGIEARDRLTIVKDSLPVDKTPKPMIYDYKSSLAAFEGKVNGSRIGNSPLPFSALFQVQALVWGNRLNPFDGLRLLEEMEKEAKTAKDCNQALPFSVESMRQLFHLIPYPEPGVDPQELNIYNLLAMVKEKEAELRRDDPLRSGEYGASLPENQAWVLRAMVTPSRIHFHGPEPESKNRVLRMFSANTDYFLRVLFCDEDGQDLAFNPRISYKAVYERYTQVLRDGIRAAGRHFSFLGFSHSSLRSHSAWFVAPFTDENLQRQDYGTIIKSLGDFRGIRVPAKCAARIGQAFSETPYAVSIVKSGIQIRSIPDVKSADGERTFSDGVGTMSWAAMEEIWSCLPMTKQPTCVQFRLGGIKGLLSLDPTLRGNVICIRKESMAKFPCDDLKDLGICDSASKPLRMYLNRQMIKIMEDMGTAKKWFMAVQEKALDTLRGATASPANTSKFLQLQNTGSNMGLPRFIKQLGNMGIDYRKDAFLRMVVEHVVLRELRLLKHKARIPVEKGVVLFGVMDESGYLKEGEIYVAFDRGREGIGRAPFRSDALVTRSPALHPGDIQRVTMVTPPSGHPLRELRNCVVFSQKGNRDLPSQLSGGDLDGDLYSVIWDLEAYPTHNFEPADYPKVSPPELDRDVTRDDMTDFFINFMKTDVLGLIAVRHQILADVMDEGTNHPDCIALAHLHSTAVDSSKTGLPVDVKNLPRAPLTRPDFLAPAPPLKLYDVGQVEHIDEQEDAEDGEDNMFEVKHKYHKSEKILGRLHRAIDEKVIWEDDIRRKVRADSEDIWSTLFEAARTHIQKHDVQIDHRQRTEEAWKIRDRYESAIESMMWQFSDNPSKHLSEVEVFCGFILNKRGSETRRQKDSSIKLREEIDRVTTWIVKMIREADNVTDGTTTFTNGHERIQHVLELCMACFEVSRAKSRGVSSSERKNVKLQSFKAIAASCLLSELIALPDTEQAGGYVGVGSSGRQQTLPLR